MGVYRFPLKFRKYESLAGGISSFVRAEYLLKQMTSTSFTRIFDHQMAVRDGEGYGGIDIIDVLRIVPNDCIMQFIDKTGSDSNEVLAVVIIHRI